MITAVRSLIGALPVSFGIGGRVNTLAVKALDPLLSRRLTAEIKTDLGPIELDMSHEPQRFMAYCYYNLKRHYALSSLGRYIQRLRPGTTFVDIGANLGFYSLLAQEAGIRAIAFEPEPQFADYLERNSMVFGRVFPVALSDQSGTLPLYYSRRNAGATSLVPRKWAKRSTATVPVERFSSFALAGKLGDPAEIALVKIDVEGGEEGTVRGMGEFLASGHRPDIWCEVRGNTAVRAKGSYSTVRTYLQDFGYSTFDAPDTAELRTPPTDEVLASRRVFDLLFRADGPVLTRAP